MTDFDSFWTHCPRKIAKGLARRTWAKQQKAGILPPIGTLILAIKAQAELYKASKSFRADGWTYFPHVSTWLNNERWDDVLPEAKVASLTAPIVDKYSELG